MSNLLFTLHITKAGGDWGEMKWSSKTNRIKTSDQKEHKEKRGGGGCVVLCLKQHASRIGTRQQARNITCLSVSAVYLGYKEILL